MLCIGTLTNLFYLYVTCQTRLVCQPFSLGVVAVCSMTERDQLCTATNVMIIRLSVLYSSYLLCFSYP